MKKLTVAALLIAAIACDRNEAERTPDGIIFEKLHGKPNSAEWVTSMSLLKNGGYVITGATDGIGFGEQNILLMKVDRDGNLLWQKSFGEAGENESGRKVIENKNGEYLLIGSTSTKGAGNSDLYLIKTDKDGNVLWDKTYGSPMGEEGYDVLALKDGYFLFGHTTNSNNGYRDYMMIKTDLNGDEVWTRTFGTDNEDIAQKMTQLKDGSIILGGYTWGNADYIDIYLVKTDTDGGFAWEKRFDGPQTLGASGDFVGNLTATSDGGFIVAGTQGYIDQTGFSGLAWILKFSEDGNLEWDKTFGTLGGDDAQAMSVVETKNGYVFAGSKLNPNDETDFYIFKTDLSGSLEWEKSINRSSSDSGVDIVADGNVFTVAGIGYELDNWYQVFLLSFKNTLENSFR